MKIEERNIEVISDEVVEVLKKKSPSERVEIAFDRNYVIKWAELLKVADIWDIISKRA